MTPNNASLSILNKNDKNMIKVLKRVRNIIEKRPNVGNNNLRRILNSDYNITNEKNIKYILNRARTNVNNSINLN